MMLYSCPVSFFFFFNDTATTEIYTLSLHDALPISDMRAVSGGCGGMMYHTLIAAAPHALCARTAARTVASRSEEHTSELQSRSDLVCRLLLEKKKTPHTTLHHSAQQIQDRSEHDKS